MVQPTQRIAYRNCVSRVIRDLTSVHYYVDNTRLAQIVEPLTQNQIASSIGVTAASLSRAVTGVSSLSGEAFYLLCKLHSSRLSCTLNYYPAFPNLSCTDYD